MNGILFVEPDFKEPPTGADDLHRKLSACRILTTSKAGVIRLEEFWPWVKKVFESLLNHPVTCLKLETGFRCYRRNRTKAWLRYKDYSWLLMSLESETRNLGVELWKTLVKFINKKVNIVIGPAGCSVY